MQSVAMITDRPYIRASAVYRGRKPTNQHTQQIPSLDRNFRNPFTEIPERLPVQPIQSDTQN